MTSKNQCITGYNAHFSEMQNCISANYSYIPHAAAACVQRENFFYKTEYIIFYTLYTVNTQNGSILIADTRHLKNVFLHN